MKFGTKIKLNFKEAKNCRNTNIYQVTRQIEEGSENKVSQNPFRPL